MMTMKEVVQEALVSLEVQGLLRKTGEPRRGVAGDLQPIYVATTMSKWLDETRLIDDFEEYLKLTARQTGSTN